MNQSTNQSTNQEPCFLKTHCSKSHCLHEFDHFLLVAFPILILPSVIPAVLTSTSNYRDKVWVDLFPCLQIDSLEKELEIQVTRIIRKACRLPFTQVECYKYRKGKKSHWRISLDEMNGMITLSGIPHKTVMKYLGKWSPPFSSTNEEN